MWTRKELKAKAKKALKNNYWKTVLVALLTLVISGGAGAASARSEVGPFQANPSTQYVYNDFDPDAVDDYSEDIIGEYGDMGSDAQSIDELPEEITNFIDEAPSNPVLPAVAVVTFSVIALAVLAIALAVEALLVNPLKVGCVRFFSNNLNRPAELKDVVYAFDHNYLETVKTMLLRDVFTILWGLLFVIPGIVKSYEYRMIPYLLANDPTMTRREAFEQSKRMMTGNKWSTFVLDLSFLGWVILSALTLGIAAIFYVAPYSNMTNAALYERLCFGAAPGPDSSATGYGVHGATQIPVAPLAADDIPTPVWDDDANGTA